MRKNNVDIDKIGKIYFFTDGDYIKIGFTTETIQKRLQRLNTGSSSSLYCLGYFSGTILDEEKTHKQFGAERLRQNGEWFIPSNRLIKYINEITEDKNSYVEIDEESQRIVKYFCIRG